MSLKQQIVEYLQKEKELPFDDATDAARITALVPGVAEEMWSKLQGERVSDPIAIRGRTARELMATYELDEVEAYKVLAWLRLETASAEGWLKDRLRDLRDNQRHLSPYVQEALEQENISS